MIQPPPLVRFFKIVLWASKMHFSGKHETLRRAHAYQVLFPLG